MNTLKNIVSYNLITSLSVLWGGDFVKNLFLLTPIAGRQILRLILVLSFLAILKGKLWVLVCVIFYLISRN